MSTKTEATVEDLYKVEGKAELVNGEIILPYARGETAEAETALPGWTMPVDDLFV